MQETAQNIWQFRTFGGIDTGGGGGRGGALVLLWFNLNLSMDK